MINRTLDRRNDQFRQRDDDEETLWVKVLYLSEISALDISFVMNLLARFSYAPTQRHWSGIKTIFRYLKATIDLGLFYPYREKAKYEKLAAFKNCR